MPYRFLNQQHLTLLLAAMLLPILVGCYAQGPGQSLREIDRPTLEVKWSLEGSMGSWFQGEDAVAVAGDKIYVIGGFARDEKESGDENEDQLDYLHALKAGTGEEVWKFGFHGMMGTVPTVAQDRVYFGMSEIGTGTYYLYCVDASSGSLNWRISLGQYQVTSSRPVISDGLVYVGTEPAITNEDRPYFVYALDASMGTEIWKYQLDGGVSYLAVADELLYVGNQDGPATSRTSKPTFLRALDSKTGSQQWALSTPHEVAAPPLVSRNTLYFKTGNLAAGEVLYALDRTTGKEAWRFQKERSTLSVPYIDDAGNNLFVGINEAREYCIDNCPPPPDYTDYMYTLDPATGGEKSHVEVIVPIQGKPAVADGILYSVGPGHTLYGYDTKSSDVKWKFKLPTTTTTWPVVSNGLIYITTWSPGGLYALSLPASSGATATVLAP